jgi:TM2 domain-containing membrane protein YozV
MPIPWGHRGHHFYLGNTGRGIVYILLVWTFIPIIIAFVELFTLTGTVERMNDGIARHISGAVKTYI